MKPKKGQRQDIINEVIKRIEAEFEGVIVVHFGTGTPSDEYQDDTESFEAFMVKDEVLEQFDHFTWDLNENLTEREYGFSISVDALNPEITQQYRSQEYRDAFLKRVITPRISDNGYIQPESFENQSEDFLRVAEVDLPPLTKHQDPSYEPRFVDRGSSLSAANSYAYAA